MTNDHCLGYIQCGVVCLNEYNNINMDVLCELV